MAKGLRSSAKKANKARLRSRVFGPVEEARKERLSAKLLETVSKPSTGAKDDAMLVDKTTGLTTTSRSSLAGSDTAYAQNLQNNWVKAQKACLKSTQWMPVNDPCAP